MLKYVPAFMPSFTRLAEITCPLVPPQEGQLLLSTELGGGAKTPYDK
jgi:hypothetical protein